MLTIFQKKQKNYDLLIIWNKTFIFIIINIVNKIVINFVI